MKRCPKCQRTLERSAFGKHAKRYDGLQGNCRECMADYYRRNKSKWAYANEEEAERKRAEARERVWKRNLDPEARQRKRERDRLSYMKNPAPYKRRAGERRERIANAPVGYFSEKDWARMLARQGHACFYCSTVTDLVPDHLIPLFRGGSHSVGNIVAACDFCNKQKGKKCLSEYRHWLLTHSEQIAV